MSEMKGKISRCLDVSFSDDMLLKLSEDDLRRIKLVNYIALISIANMLLYVIVYSIIDFQLFRHAIIFLTTACVVSSGIIIINKKGKYQAAKILLSVLTPLYMVYIATVAFGKAPGFQVYLLVAAIIPLFLWNYRQRVYPIIIISTILIVYAYIEFFLSIIKPMIILPENLAYIFKMTNVTVCFTAAGAAIGVLQFLYRKKEELLDEQAEELKISQAHKDKVYSIIAHDLRSPFGTFAGFTELFINEYYELSDEQRLKIIQLMNKTSVSLKNLLENLLDWSRMQTGNLEKSLKHINLRKIVEESLALHRELILQKEQKTEVDIDSSYSIYADHHMISTVFRNFISNAIKFTKLNGKISISACPDGARIKICIKDSGEGLSQKDIKYLFDIRNVDKISGSSSQKGSGLGLILCKDFIESHDGKVWVESELGKGTTFCFTLPKSMDQ